MDRELKRDLKTLGRFIDVYCRHRHQNVPKSPVCLKTHDVEAIVGRSLRLCAQCAKLLAHAFTKRSNCPLEPKPACRHCPQHCYHCEWRLRIQEVMKYSGMRLVLSGRIDYLYHLLF